MPKKLRMGSIEKVQAQQDRLREKYGPETPLYGDMSERYHHDPIPIKPTYYYVFGITKEGKKLFVRAQDARDADSILTTFEDGEIFEMGTKNLAAATREIKAILLQRSQNPDYAIQRMKHKLPERR